jgi:hypothetical protein
MRRLGTPIDLLWHDPEGLHCLASAALRQAGSAPPLIERVD